MFDFIRKSLLGKLTLSITLVALIPLLIFNFAFFRLLSQNYTRDRINNIQNILGQIALGVSADIETYHEYAYYLANDMTIMGFVTFEQNSADIIETVNLYIKPWVNRLYYGNEMIQSIRIIHNNPSLFNVNNLLFETDKVRDKITRLAQLNDSTRIPIRAIEYQQEGHLYPFTPYSTQDHDVWYLYHAISPVSRTHSPGLIEIAVHNDLLFNRISELTFEPDSFMIVVTDSGQTIISSGHVPDQNQWPELTSFLSTGSYEASIKNVRYTVVSQRIDAIAGTALYLMPKSNFLTAGQMGFLLLLSIIIIFAATLTIATLVSRLLLKKLLHLSNTINGIDLNHINQSVPIESPDETGQLAHNFNTMLTRLNRSFEREKHLLFAQLTSNMRPHFICNILEMLRIQAEKEEQAKIANSIAKINQYFRYSIMYTQNMVSLAEELSDTINYIELVNLMRQNKIRHIVSYDAWSEIHARQIKIPKQIIQPIVENSIRHGLSRKIAGCITIQVNKIDNGIKIVISDNGSGMSKEKLEELNACLKGEITHEPESGRHMGLINVVKRLELRMNDQFDLSIESNEGTGTIITIMIYQVPDNPLESIES